MTERLDELLDKQELSESEKQELDDLIKLDMQRDKVLAIPSFDDWLKLNNEVKDLTIKRRTLELELRKRKEIERIKELEAQRDGLIYCQVCEKMVNPKTHFDEKLYCDDCKEWQDHKHFQES